MQVAQYVRMSTASQDDSPDTQKAYIKEYCDKNGHVIIKTYEDLGISGGSIDKREAMLEMLMDAEKRLFEAILIYKYDRAFRNLAEQVFALKKLEKANVKLIAVADPNSDGASGDLVRNILGAVNQFERQLTGERIYDKNRQLAQKGMWTGSGINPLGYVYDKDTKQLTIEPREAELVRYIFQLYLDLKSSTKVTDILRNEGYLSKTGLPFNPNVVVNILRNPLYAGYRRWGRYIKRNQLNKNFDVYKANHEPIIDEQVVNKTNEIMQHNATSHVPGPDKRVYILSGLLRCHKCTGPVSGHFHHTLKKQVYRCINRYQKGINYCTGWNKLADKLEPVVLHLVTQNINAANLNADYDTNLPAANTTSINKQIESLNNKLARQVDMYEEGIITKDEFKKRREKTLREKESLENKLEESQIKTVSKEMLNTLSEFEHVWEHLTPPEKKELLRAIIEVIYADKHIVIVIFKDMGIKNWSLELKQPL